MPNGNIDLKARAHRAMVEAGFQPDFPPEVLREATSAKQGATNPRRLPVKDMRSLLWSSIDNDSSRDLDQIEFVDTLPDGNTRLLVGIADVDLLVPKGTATVSSTPEGETTSVYTGVATYPMLPDQLSTDTTSLVNAQDRSGIVIELHIRPQSGEVVCHDVYCALLRNHAKLAYNSVGAWLEGRGAIPQAAAIVPGMEAQLRLQNEMAKKLKEIRKKSGALTFESQEARVVLENNEVTGLTVDRQNAAQDIIENFMVAANVAMARHLKENKSLSIRRVVKTPKRWDRICELASAFGVKLPSTPDPRALLGFPGSAARGGSGAFSGFVVLSRWFGGGEVNISWKRRATSTKGILVWQRMIIRTRQRRIGATRIDTGTTFVEGDGGRQGKSLFASGVERNREAVHRAGRCREKGGALDAKGGCGEFVEQADRRNVRRHHHGSVAEGNICAAVEISGRGNRLCAARRGWTWVTKSKLGWPVWMWTGGS